MCNTFELTDVQRNALLDFITQADAIIGDGSFDPQVAWSNVHLITFALRSAMFLGYADAKLEALFEREFGIAGVTEGILGEALAVAASSDVERRIRAAGGGRN